MLTLTELSSPASLRARLHKEPEFGDLVARSLLSVEVDNASFLKRLVTAYVSDGVLDKPIAFWLDALVRVSSSLIPLNAFLCVDAVYERTLALSPHASVDFDQFVRAFVLTRHISSMDKVNRVLRETEFGLADFLGDDALLRASLVRALCATDLFHWLVPECDAQLFTRDELVVVGAQLLQSDHINNLLLLGKFFDSGVVSFDHCVLRAVPLSANRSHLSGLIDNVRTCLSSVSDFRSKSAYAHALVMEVSRVFPMASKPLPSAVSLSLERLIADCYVVNPSSPTALDLMHALVQYPATFSTFSLALVVVPHTLYDVNDLLVYALKTSNTPATLLLLDVMSFDLRFLRSLRASTGLLTVASVVTKLDEVISREATSNPPLLALGVKRARVVDLDALSSRSVRQACSGTSSSDSSSESTAATEIVSSSDALSQE